jgi:broad specificity phosphatase PhoE
MTVVHLVRHGRVANPQKVVYGRQPGWHLSDVGRAEAAAAAERLRGRPVARVYTSPLERARETAETIAAAGGWPVEVREELLEAQLCEPWVGRRWSDVRETEAVAWRRYLTRPHEITDVPETLDAMAGRMAAAVRRLAEDNAGREVVAVSHGDPIKSAVLALTGEALRHLHRLPVPTGGIVTLAFTPSGVEVRERWEPPVPRR